MGDIIIICVIIFIIYVIVVFFQWLDTPNDDDYKMSSEEAKKIVFWPFYGIMFITKGILMALIGYLYMLILAIFKIDLEDIWKKIRKLTEEE